MIAIDLTEHRSDYITKKSIIEMLQALPKNKLINRKTLTEYSKQKYICSYHTIVGRFGSIKNACKEAGVRCDALYGKEKMNRIVECNTKYTKKGIIKILQDGFKKFGKVSPTALIENINKDTNSDIRGGIYKFFGIFTAAVKEANIEYHNHYWTNKRIIDTLRKLNKKYGPLYKVQINDFSRKKILCGGSLIKNRFGNLDNAARMAGFEFVEPQCVGHQNGGIGLTETKQLDLLEEKYGIILERQYKVNINGKIYFIDGYDKKNNVCYEIDEKYHSWDKQQLIDEIRDERIINFLNCQIIKIKNY